MKAPRQIDTARLTLVQPTVNDAADIYGRYASDAEVTRYLAWPRHQSIADTQAFLDHSAAQWERWPAGAYLIRSRGDGRLLGGTGLGFETPTRVVTGYVLARDAWGRGYATETLTAITELAHELGIARLSAFCHPDHRASWRVLAKCGFVRDVVWTTPAEFPNLAPGLLQNVLRYERVLDP